VKASADDKAVMRRDAPPRARAPEREQEAPGAAGAAVSPRERPMTRAVAQRLQASAGNRAVAGLLAKRRPPQAKPVPKPVQRLAQPPAQAPAPATAPAEGARSGPESDPKFAALTGDVRGKQKLLSAHPPPAGEAAAGQAASLPPQDDRLAQGKAANAEKMNAAPAGSFDKAGFIAAVNAAIAQQAPKNLDEADRFADSGKANGIKAQVTGKVQAGKDQSAGPIETATKAPPDTSAAKDKPVTPLVADKPPATPGAPNPANAVPDPAPPAATDFSAGPAEVNAQMADAEVTEDQLRKGNEPEFDAALVAKKDGEDHAKTAPGQVRGMEAATLTSAKANAQALGAGAMAGMSADRKLAGTQVDAGKVGAKDADHDKRAQVTATLQKVFDATQRDVQGILDGLDKKVDDKFGAEEGAARAAFTAEHKRRMDAYKDARYSGLLGKGRWLKDKFAGLPEEANQIFVQARQIYVNKMQAVISSVADLIGTELGKAKARIAQGRTDLQNAVNALPKDLQAIGKEKAGEFSAQFDELTSSVDAKGEELVQTLASKYKDALGKVDDEIAEEKAKNRGLIDKAKDAIAGVIKTIIELKNMLLGILAKAAGVVMAIIKDPIGFVGRLFDALGAGFKLFMANIGPHLSKGLVGWLLGAMAGVGFAMPARFDLRGIIVMVAGMLGLTWAALRARAVSKGVPDPVMTTVERSVPMANRLQSGGPESISEEIKDQVGDLRENLLGKIAKYLIPTVIIAGVTWLLSLLTPASAFVKACKAIIDVLGFIIQRGAQIIALVNAVLDAVIAVAGGGGGSAPSLIEKALAVSIPVLIGFLAALLGLGNIAEKVKSIFQTITKPITKAIDWVVDKIVKAGKAIWNKLKSKFGKKDKDGKPDDKADKGKVAKQAADAGLRAVKGASVAQIPGALDGVFAQYQSQGLKGLEIVAAGDHRFRVKATVNPTVESQGQVSLDVSPEKLPAEHAVPLTRRESETTVASGALTADTYQQVTAVMRSGEGKRKLALTDSAQGAHAEEQIVNHFERGWDTRGSEIRAALPPDLEVPAKLYSGAKLQINISRGSCINCASHIARFKRSMDGDATTVVALIKFPSVYTKRQTVADTNMTEFGDTIRHFVKTEAKLTAGAVGRVPGRLSTTGGQQGPATSVRGGSETGKASLGILRNAGIEVQGLAESDIEGDLDAQRKARLQARNDALAKALAQVEAELPALRAKRG
jgi:hypothetical protein